MRTTWLSVPKELRDAASPLIDKHKRWVPDWVRLITVAHDSEMADAYACMSSEPNAKRAQLTFGPGWLDLDAWEREVTVVHEIVHTWFAPIERVFGQIFDVLPAKAKKLADKLLEDALEEAVAGIAHMIVGQEG